MDPVYKYTKLFVNYFYIFYICIFEAMSCFRIEEHTGNEHGLSY